VPNPLNKPTVLFLCTGNACRSQMAEGWARALRQDFEARSAGIAPKGVDPLAVKAMAEVGIDLTGYRSKPLEEFDPSGIDLVVTVCDHASEACPTLPGSARIVHHGFEDPPALARASAPHGEAMAHYRRVRDQIRAMVESLEQPEREARPSRHHGVGGEAKDL